MPHNNVAVVAVVVALCACGALAANNCVPMRLRGGQAIGQIGNMRESPSCHQGAPQGNQAGVYTRSS